jgi:hypothetical protein
MDTATTGDATKGSSSLCVEPKSPQTMLRTSSQEFDIKDSEPTDGVLCARCALVDLDAALSSEQEAILIEDSGPVKEWNVSSCTLCKHLASIIPEWMRGSSAGYRLATKHSHSARVKNDIPLLQALPPTKLLELYCGSTCPSFYSVPQYEGFDLFDRSKLARSNFLFLKIG